MPSYTSPEGLKFSVDNMDWGSGTYGDAGRAAEKAIKWLSGLSPKVRMTYWMLLMFTQTEDGIETNAINSEPLIAIDEKMRSFKPEWARNLNGHNLFLVAEASRVDLSAAALRRA